jgi:hypothetical protein
METRITLTVSDEDGGRELADIEPFDVRSILNDALKEYISRRQPAREYVAGRYAGSNLDSPEKVRSIERRNRLATYLARADVMVSR